MSLTQGSLTFRRFFIQGACKPSSDNSWIEGLRASAFIARQLEAGEEQSGWAVMDNELSTDFITGNTVVGKYVVFSLRTDTLKIAKSLIALHLTRRVNERMGQAESDCIGLRERAELKEEIIEQLQEETPPTIRTCNVMVDTARGEVYLMSKAEKTLDVFANMMLKSFDLTIIDANYTAAAQRFLPEELFERVLDCPGVALADAEVHPEFEDTPEGKLGSAFLTWLLHYLQTGDGMIDSACMGEVGVYIDDHILMEGETAGIRHAQLKKGTPGTCPELATALKAGKQVSKAKVFVGREVAGEDAEQEQWAFLIDKVHFCLSSIKVPKYDEPDAFSRFIARLNSITDVFGLIDELLETFLKARYALDKVVVDRQLREWVDTIVRGES